MDVTEDSGCFHGVILIRILHFSQCRHGICQFDANSKAGILQEHAPGVLQACATAQCVVLPALHLCRCGEAHAYI